MTPMSPPSLCTNRCGTLVYGGGMCPTCLTESRKEAESRRPKDRRKPYDATWRAYSRDFLSRHRECEGPACMRLPWYARPTATQVDHKDGLGPSGPRGYDDNNLSSLCASCHSSKTARFDGGFGHPKRHNDG